MYNDYQSYPCPYYMSMPIYNADIMYNAYRTYPCPFCNAMSMYSQDLSYQCTSQNIPFTDEMTYHSKYDLIEMKDYGPEPFVVNIDEATKQNKTFRTVLWTGSHLQLTLMSIKPGQSIGLEIHPNIDQFIRIEDGQGLVKMGDRKDSLDFQKNVYDDFAFIIPAGKWHNIINTGNKPLKLYSIYAPPQHPHGTVHSTKEMAEAIDGHRNNYSQSKLRNLP